MRVVIVEYDPQRGEYFGISKLVFNIPKGYVFEDDKQIENIHSFIFSPSDIQMH